MWTLRHGRFVLIGIPYAVIGGVFLYFDKMGSLDKVRRNFVAKTKKKDEKTKFS